MASIALTALAATALAGLLAAGTPAHSAQTHALILTIGDYIEPSAKLRGVAEDAVMAEEIVWRLGARHIVRLADRQLDFRGLQQALRDLRARTRAGDTVIVYYSGHGRRQSSSLSSSGCQEALVTVDNRSFFDTALLADMQALAAKALRVIVFNDSCHSAGAATKGLDLSPARGGADAQPKAWPAHLHEPNEAEQAAAMKQASPEAQAACSQVSNLVARSFGLGPGPENRLVYLAASAADEVAWATPQGSQATQAWHQCITRPQPGIDSNRDGALSAGELAQCAQHWLKLNFPGRLQRITPMFNTSLPLASVAVVPGR